MDGFRFKAPVRPGDTLGALVHVADAKQTSNPARGILSVRVQVTNQRQEVVLEYSATVLIAR
jgi:acyl dehydratase